MKVSKMRRRPKQWESFWITLEKGDYLSKKIKPKLFSWSIRKLIRSKSNEKQIISIRNLMHCQVNPKRFNQLKMDSKWTTWSIDATILASTEESSRSMVFANDSIFSTDFESRFGPISLTYKYKLISKVWLLALFATVWSSITIIWDKSVKTPFE